MRARSEAQLLGETARKKEVRGVTTADAARLARELYAPPRDDETPHRRRQAREAFDADLRALLRELRDLDRRVERVRESAVENELDRWMVRTGEALSYLTHIYEVLQGGDQ